MPSPAAESDPDCARRGIPDLLHAVGKPLIQDFHCDERLFRRFRPEVKIINQKPPGSIFEFRKMSVVREKFCARPEDALFDESDLDMSSWGIAALTVAKVQGQEYKHPQSGSVYTFKLRHDPKKCMYPHSEVDVFENGSPVGEMKPQSLKLAARDFLANACAICKYPSPTTAI